MVKEQESLREIGKLLKENVQNIGMFHISDNYSRIVYRILNDGTKFIRRERLNFTMAEN